MTPRTYSGSRCSSFWSPDSRYLAFYADGRLKRVDANGGSVLTLAEGGGPHPGAWGRNGVILFSHQATGRIHRVPAEGGVSTAVDPTDTVGIHLSYYPSFLPDGEHFLYLQSRDVYVGSLNEAGGTLLIEDAGNAMYASGYLLFPRETTLFAQSFDVERLELRGSPFPLAEQLRISTGSGAGAYSVSNNGVLLYLSSDATPSQLTWLDRNGREVGVLGEEGAFSGLHLSSDGLWAAAGIRDPGADSHDIWVFDLRRDVRTRVTTDDADDTDPLLSPDGRYVVFSSRRGERKSLVLREVGGAADPEPLLEDGMNKNALGWSADGSQLLFSRWGGPSSYDLWTVVLEGDGMPVPLVETAANEPRGAVSPDGRFVLLQSDQSGRYEVYLAPFPGGGAPRPISSLEGTQPRWHDDGSEIFFLSGSTLMHALVHAADPGLEIGAARPLFDLKARIGTVDPLPGRSLYSVTSDAQRFLFVLPVRPVPDAMTLVVNWPSLLPE